MPPAEKAGPLTAIFWFEAREKIKNDKHNVKYIATTKEIYLDNIKHKIQVEQSWSNGSNIYLYKL